MKKLEGFYKGKVLNLPLGWIWQGKEFYFHDFVVNKIFGFRAIEGIVKYLDNGVVIIRYPQLGLEDTLIHIGNDIWMGELKFWKFSIYFTLQYEGTPKEIQTKPKRASERKDNQPHIEGE